MAREWRDRDMTADKNNDQDHTVLRGSVTAPGGDTVITDPQLTRVRVLHAEEPETHALWINPDVNSTAAAGVPVVGDILGGRYRLERELGQGGMGVVFLASDQEVRGESFAIKVLKPEIRAHPEAVALLREEVRTTRALRRDTIVGVYSLNSDRHNIFMLMEYLEGKTLDALLSDEFARGMPFSRAWPLIEDVCDGLAYAHDHNVIHSDLKPSNVFVTTSGRAKLVDFGIARAARTRAGRFDPGSVGALTVAYASNEMLAGGTPDHTDDIYGLGCILYEMLSGKHPFGSLSAVEARGRGLKVAPVPGLTAAQNAALRQALAFDRLERTPTVELLLQGLNPNARVARSALPAAPRSARTLWFGVAGAGLIAVLAGLGVQAWNRVHERPRIAAEAAAAAAAGYERLAASVRAMQGKASSLDVDPADPGMVLASKEVAAADARFAAGAVAEAADRLAAAATSIDRAIASGRRVALIGSTANELDDIKRMCREFGKGCAVSDVADEAARMVTLTPYALGADEVSNRAFAEFVDATHYRTAAEINGGLYEWSVPRIKLRKGESWKTLRDAIGSAADSAEYAVRGIDFRTANDYCLWRKQRLPSEAEWEFDARGPERRLFAWGNAPRAADSASASLAPVGSQPATGRFGTRGLGTGLLEWVAGGSTEERVARGVSSSDTNPIHQLLTMRRLFADTDALVDTGIRCARSIDRWPAAKK